MLENFIFRGNIKILQYLVARKDVSINEQDKQGCTPLILGAVYNNSVCVSLLLKGGASVFRKDKLSQNVLHKAAKEGSMEVVDTINNFLKKMHEEQFYKHRMGILMRQGDVRGNTPLMLALDSVITGNTLSCLLEIDKNLGLKLIYQRNAMNETPLHRACR